MSTALFSPSVKYVIDAGLVQVVAIVPTLIIVQVGLGRHVEDGQSTASADAAVPGGSSTPVLDSIFSTDQEPLPIETEPMTDISERNAAGQQAKGMEGSLGLGAQPLSQSASLRSAQLTYEGSRDKEPSVVLHSTSSPFPSAGQKVESKSLSHHSSRLSMTTPRRSHSHDTIPMIPPRRSMSISRLDA